MALLTKQSLAEQAYNEIRKDIISQNIGWGERLNVPELQQKFGLSSTPIREALNRLQKEGLVEYKTNFGAKVIDLSEESIKEIQEVAFALDAAAIRYALKKATRAEIGRELSVQIEAYKKATSEEDRSKATFDFIEVFYKYAENNRLIMVSHGIKAQQIMLKSVYGKIKKEVSGMEDHIRICEAVLNGDVTGAIRALEDNYNKGTEYLLCAETFPENLI